MDPYVYPGTNVLQNLRNIREPHRLAAFEMDLATFRLVELSEEPPTGQFDTRHLQSIHRRIFQDVYPWAGTFRTVNLSKDGDLFALHEHIATSLAKTTLSLAQERHLVGADHDTFATRMAYYFGELNAIHPFREGNGRAQREFFRQLALQAGFVIDWSLVSGPRMIQASRQSLRGDNRQLEQLLHQTLRPSS